MSMSDAIDRYGGAATSAEPLVTVITPSLNQGHFLEAAILSVLEQDYARIEYLVIDGGSTDNSSEIIRRYSARLAGWESQPDRGQAHAINKGLQRAHGEILGWLNADDILLPGTVRRVVAAFRDHPDVDVVYGRLGRIDKDGAPVETPQLPKDRIVFSKQYVVSECVVNQPGCFWRRRAMQHVGGLDERLHYALDYDFWIRLALAGARFERLDETLANFRLSAGSKTVAHTAAMALEQMVVLDDLVGQPDLAGELGWTADQLSRQVHRARARIALHASYGFFKLGQRRQCLSWLRLALIDDPMVLFERRWLDLGLAGLRRRVRHAAARDRRR